MTAMLVPGAGPRTAAALLIALALVPARGALASDREDASAALQQSAGIAVGPGSASGSRSPSLALPPPGSPRDPDFVAEDVHIAPVGRPTLDEELLFDLVNIEREARGLPPLQWDGTLSRLARLHAYDMISTGRPSHNSSRDGASYSKRLSRTSYRAKAAAENLAYNADVVTAHRALMASLGHKHNVLDPTLTALGTAVVYDPRIDRTWVVEDFATPVAHVSDAEAAERLRDALSRERRSRLPEDKAISGQLGGLLERMIATGSVQEVVPQTEDPGWALSFTSLDPDSAPASAIEKARDAEAYAMAVSFRKTPRYPFGAYWAILFLKGQY